MIFPRIKSWFAISISGKANRPRAMEWMNQRAEDLMMQAPSEATNEQSRDLHIRVIPLGWGAQSRSLPGLTRQYSLIVNA